PSPVFRNVTETDQLADSPVAGVGVMDEKNVQDLMWKCVGLFRDRSSLLYAASQLAMQEADLEARLASSPRMDHAAWRRASLVTVAALIARAALRRQESRGGHFRTD